MKAEFGIADESAKFGSTEVDFEVKAIKKLLISLHPTPKLGADALDRALAANLSRDENLAAVANPLTGPIYGGFAGMNGSVHRKDDPGSGVEKKRPFSFNAVRWDAFQELGNTLQVCMKKIKDNPNGPDSCEITDIQIRNMIHNITNLSHHAGSEVAPFEPSDWSMERVKTWYFTRKTGALAGLTREGECGKTFFLNDDGLGGEPFRVPDDVAFATLTTCIVARTTADLTKLPFVSKA